MDFSNCKSVDYESILKIPIENSGFKHGERKRKKVFNLDETQYLEAIGLADQKSEFNK